MLTHEKEHILYRIFCNSLFYRIPGYKLEIRYPTLRVRYLSTEVFNKTYKKSLKNGLIKEDKIKQFLYKNSLFLPEDDKILETAPKHIEYFKKELFLNYGSSTKVEQIKKYLNKAKESYSESFAKLHSYDYITAEGVANFAKWQFIIEHSTFYKKKKWNWKSGAVHEALNFYYENLIPDEQIREIAHTQPFDNIWSTSKPFRKPGIKLTLDQQRLIWWAKLYTNINESPEPPPKKVIDDDDMLDGWLLIQKEKREQQDRENTAKSILSPKIANADEVFIMANREEPTCKMDAAEVNSLNNHFAKQIIKDRLKQIERSGGQLKEQELLDVKQKISMQQVQSLRGKYGTT